MVIIATNEESIAWILHRRMDRYSMWTNYVLCVAVRYSGSHCDCVSHKTLSQTFNFYLNIW